MHEVELKFQVPPDRRSAVAAAVAGRGRPVRTRLQAAYFDTTDGALAAAGLALRVRHEGRRWVQTLKGAGADGLTREEHNVALPADPGQADPALHHGTAVGRRLRAVLEAAPGLGCVFRTDIRRTHRRLRTRGGSVELAFDEGEIAAGARRVAVCELEIELLSGTPSAVIETARRWVPRHGLWLDTRSKAERGALLARGETAAPPRGQHAVELARGLSLAQGLRCALRSCFDQVSVNASQIASGEHGTEHLHQLRVGLRRLRTALRLFGAETSHAELAEPAAALFRQLGAARDRDAVALPLQGELARALASAGLPFAAPPMPAPGGAAEPAALLRDPAAQLFLLESLARVQADPAPPADEAPPLRDALARRIGHWHRKAADAAGRFAELDDTARHGLRKRAKDLRYATEFAAALFARRRVRRYLKPLRRLQDRLGTLVDLVTALAAYRGSTDAHALFALGWLAARRDALLRKSVADVAAFADAERFWKR